MVGHLWQNILIVELHGDEPIQDLLKATVRDVVEGLDVMLCRQCQIKGLLIIHFI